MNSSNDRLAVAIIPARGNSKRFPRKNIALLNGLPLIAYPILAALSSKLIDIVYVSTEDDEIASISLEYGASVPFKRPPEFSGDYVTADKAVSHMLRTLIYEHHMPIDISVLIQPTSPFVLPLHIDQSISLLTNNNFDSVTTMTEVDHRHHPYNLSYPDDNNGWEFIFPYERSQALARQDKPSVYQFGNLFATKANTMIDHGRFGASKGSVYIEPIYSWDIDFEWELKAAEYLLTSSSISLPHLLPNE